MWQQIITLLIIALAVGITIRSIWNKFRNKSISEPCKGCGDSCDGCAVMELKKEIERQPPEQKK